MLNEHRVRMQLGIAIAAALVAATTNEPVSRDWAEAAVPDDALVEEVLYQANANRKEAKIKAALGWGV